MKPITQPRMYVHSICLPTRYENDTRYIADVDREITRRLAGHIACGEVETVERDGKHFRCINVVVASENEYWDAVERAALELTQGLELAQMWKASIKMYSPGSEGGK